MIKLVETFKDFIDTASISQGSQAWTIYGANPIINDVEGFTSKYLIWLEDMLDKLVSDGKINNIEKFDTLLNARYSLDGATPEEIIELLSKYHTNVNAIISKII